VPNKISSPQGGSDEMEGALITESDPWLKPHKEAILGRYRYYQQLIRQYAPHGGLLGQISQGHHYFGFNKGTHNGTDGLWYREWAPAAKALFLTGDFCGWDRGRHPLSRNEFGIWEIFLPGNPFAELLTHGSCVKVHVVTNSGSSDRIPAYIRRTVQDPNTHGYLGQYWDPPQPYVFKHPSPVRTHRCGIRIYESHVGMATEEPKVGSFAEFRINVLPYIAQLGYNAVQLMAIMEHPYYASFGYHVSNLFAVSSRFGTPEDLKELIDAAHGMGLTVLLDVVHSHAIKNINEGLNLFDGTDYQYFHAGARGQHVAWDSLCFNYAVYEVQRLLLSNLRYWLEEFKFDGFRFDGVTSMLYLDHGLGAKFTSYDSYFGSNVDGEALAYLQLANTLTHEVNPHAITIAEDVSGLPGMARPVVEGGLGFDYRLAMGVPDFWIKLLKERRDEDWNLSELFHTLLNRRHDELHVGYAESHDQALVGDKTIAFWLMDKDMYSHMSKFAQSTIIDRGLALHKMIRLITFSLAGEGYLNFMGNEFGHPEWIDFPRPGNQYSYHYARRLWSLAHQDHLHYQGLWRFDQAMNQLDQTYGSLCDLFIEQLLVHEDTKQLVYRRGPLVFIFNFHPTESYANLRLPVPDHTDYRIVLSTDETRFDGHGRATEGTLYPIQTVPMYGREQSIQIYLPSRSSQVICPVGLVR
jgi:1,4-alpha-glucan branching enzyme